MNPARLSKSYEVRFTVFAKGSPTLMIDRSRTAAKSILIVFMGSILGSLVALRQLRVHLQSASSANGTIPLPDNLIEGLQSA